MAYIVTISVNHEKHRRWRGTFRTVNAAHKALNSWSSQLFADLGRAAPNITAHIHHDHDDVMAEVTNLQLVDTMAVL